MKKLVLMQKQMILTQQTLCGAPVCWPKYTTDDFLLKVKVSLFELKVHLIWPIILVLNPKFIEAMSTYVNQSLG